MWDFPGSKTSTGPACVLSDNVGVRSMSFNFQTAESLDQLVAMTFAALLLDTTNSLEVLRRTINIQPIPLNHNPPLTESKCKSSCSAEHERMLKFYYDIGFEPVVSSVPVKLMRQRDLAYNVFRKVACELESKEGNYEQLRLEVNKIVETKETECSLEVSLSIWKDLEQSLLEAKKTCEAEFLSQKEEYLETLEDLNKKIDSSYCINVDHLDYVSKSEKSKLEQLNLKQSFEEAGISRQIKEIEDSRKAHYIVTGQLQAYLNASINHSENQITAWNEEYRNELAKRQQTAIDIQEKIEEIIEFLEKSRELQSQRQVVIDEYNDEQAKIQEEAEYWVAVHQAATMIQAHWKGYMVKHELGQYHGLIKRLQREKKMAKKSKTKLKKGKKKGK